MKRTDSKKIEIHHLIDICLNKNLVFAAYRQPGKLHSEMMVQLDPQLNTLRDTDDYFQKKGFLVVPFISKSCCSPFKIHADFHIEGQATLENKQRLESLNENPYPSSQDDEITEFTRDEYLHLIQKILKEIEHGSLEKLVPSRIKRVSGQYRDQLGAIFDRLSQAYPNAFVYIFNAGNECWMGATPEPLIQSEHGWLKTVSIAATRAYNTDNLDIRNWNRKELTEQEYVTQYIESVLSDYSISVFEKNGPYAEQAGNLVHLKTDFVFKEHILKDNLQHFLKRLHPTPAICGIPREVSLQLLEQLEHHQRKYYSGFLGPVGVKPDLSLFVNLRCMKVMEDGLALYVGGGITADSEPSEEWKETEMKSETLLSLIQD